MDRITLKNYCKFNPVLEILGKDGTAEKHFVSTVLCNLDYFDVVTVERGPQTQTDARDGGMPAHGQLEILLDKDASAHILDPGDKDIVSISFKDEIPVDYRNSVSKAWKAVSAYAGVPLSARIRLLKRIPPESGLGGGSGNAAAALVGLCRVFDLPVLPDEIESMAAEIGADVPFFLSGGLMIGEHFGEIMTALEHQPKFYALVLKPVRGSSTREAYTKMSAMLEFTGDGPARAARSTRKFTDSLDSGASVIPHMRNDFDLYLLKNMPEAGAVFGWLQSNGAEKVLAAGSGSAICGIYSTRPDADLAALAKEELGAILELAIHAAPHDSGIEVVDWE